jgi:hypothetical protein
MTMQTLTHWCKRALLGIENRSSPILITTLVLMLVGFISGLFIVLSHELQWKLVHDIAYCAILLTLFSGGCLLAYLMFNMIVVFLSMLRGDRSSNAKLTPNSTRSIARRPLKSERRPRARRRSW